MLLCSQLLAHKASESDLRCGVCAMQLLMPYCGCALASLTAEWQGIRWWSSWVSPAEIGPTADTAGFLDNQEAGITRESVHSEESAPAGLENRPRRRLGASREGAGQMASSEQRESGEGSDGAKPRTMCQRKVSCRRGQRWWGVMTVVALISIASQLPAALYFCGIHQRSAFYAHQALNT